MFVLTSKKTTMTQSHNKLITEYPFKQAVGIYLGMWKRLILAAIKSLIGIALILLVVQFVGPLIVSTGIKIISNSFWAALDFLATHRLMVLGAIVLLAALFVILRTARTSNPTKW
jgi:hypothetical protein